MDIIEESVVTRILTHHCIVRNSFHHMYLVSIRQIDLNLLIVYS
jgi:hypothetical protein